MGRMTHDLVIELKYGTAFCAMRTYCDEYHTWLEQLAIAGDFVLIAQDVRFS